MNEEEVRALLIKATEDRPAGIDLMPTMPRGRPARVLVPIASLGVAAAVGAIVLALVLPASPSSAQAQVAAAVENTSQESYRIHATSGAKTFDGAFDPVRRVGVITRVGDGAETRFIGDLMYIREHREGKWMVSSRSEVELKSVPAVIALVKLAPLDPQEALQRLRSATDVRENGSASGQGWTGRRFAFSLEDVGEYDSEEAAGKSLEATGAVEVDDQGRIRRLEVAFSDTSQRNVMDFDDFGTPVTVTAPPANQVEQPSPDKLSDKATDKPIVKKS
ncbi:hypothetical protein [Nonomuraea basaltis]|uniref:hypothetical protein n=1 Tax=Nonomuraea basaltis TaxID=2495887 RepID=UPI00110C454C|nr:hypothetical protein [Nonomuraea basaltis]TMR90062.1 hypothetical protein EJK15_57405 [Nonomuraea basaltis]